MERSLKLLIIEDDPDDAELMVKFLHRGGIDPSWKRVDTADGLQSALANEPWDVILSDCKMPGFGATAALRIVREFDEDLPFLVVTGAVGDEVAAELIRDGANDCVLKINLTRLAPALDRELRQADNRRARRRSDDTTRVSETRYRRLFEAAQDGILIVDAISRRILDVNPFLTKLLGYTQEDLVGKELWEIGLFGDIEASKAAFSVLLAEGYVRYDNQPLMSKDGRAVEVEFVSNMYAVGANQVIQCNIRDDTERKRAEKALRTSEERYRTLIAATAAIVWDSPPSGAFDSDQPAWTAFTGQTVEQHRGWGWLNAIHPDDREKSELAWGTAVRDGNVYLMEHRVRRADGEYREMSARAVPIFGPSRSIREWVGVHTDVTDQRQLEKALQSSQKHLQHALASSPSVLFTLSIVDQQIQGINWISENLHSLLGYSPEDAFAPDWWLSNVHPDDREKAISQTEEELFAHGHSAHEYRFRHRDGHYLWTHGEIRLIRDEMGAPAEAVGAWSDITPRKLLEDQFHQAQKMEAFGQLAGGVAHDFNNLLTIINGYSELILGNFPPETRLRTMVGEILKAGQRSAGLTRQLLAFSRKQVLAPRILNLNKVVTDTETILRRLIGEDIRLTTTLSSSPWSVRADPGQIEQVLLNLAVNARDAMPKGGRLTIETRNIKPDERSVTHNDVRAGPHVLLSVTDTGDGIPPAVIAKVFEPYFTTKELGKGTGLGLATVHGIVQQSGGHIAVSSEVGVGTTFSVYLPQAGPTTNISKPPSRELTPPHGTETILLAEDEVGVRTLTSNILLGCGYRVLEAANGDEALRLADEYDGPIHLFLTDVVMPGTGGRAAAEQLIDQRPNLRVLFMSGYTDDAIIRHGVLREEVNFIQKPFGPLALALKVREVLDAPAKA